MWPDTVFVPKQINNKCLHSLFICLGMDNLHSSVLFGMVKQKENRYFNVK